MEKEPDCPYRGKPMERGLMVISAIPAAKFRDFFHMGWYRGDDQRMNIPLTDPNYDVLYEIHKVDYGRTWIRAYRCQDREEVLFNYHIEGSRHYLYPKSGKKVESE
jgi:hypothetical protein